MADDTKGSSGVYEGDGTNDSSWFDQITLDDRPTNEEIDLSEKIKDANFGEV